MKYLFSVALAMALSSCSYFSSDETFVWEGYKFTLTQKPCSIDKVKQLNEAFVGLPFESFKQGEVVVEQGEKRQMCYVKDKPEQGMLLVIDEKGSGGVVSPTGK